MTLTPEHMRQTLRTALIYSFEAHGYESDEAMILASIAIEPCAATIDLCNKIIQLQLEASAMMLRKDPP